MKRILTLIGGILGTVFQGFLVYEALIFTAVFAELLGASTEDVSGGALLVTISVILLAGTIIALIFNAISISAWNKEPEKFRKKRGFIITASVLNFIIVVLAIIGFSSANEITFLAAMEMFGLVAAGVLMIIDLNFEKKRVAEYAETTSEVEGIQTEPEQTDSTQEQAKMTTLEEKIMKLNQMKEQGLIDEAEYSELKKKYIKETL